MSRERTWTEQPISTVATEKQAKQHFDWSH